MDRMFIKKKGNVSEDKKIGQSETIAIEPPITATPSQIDSNVTASNPAIYRYRPNNAFLKVRILSWDSSFHLPVIKKTGKNTIKEYLFWKNATFERAKNSNWLFVYIKKRFVRVLESEVDVDQANQEYKDNAIAVLHAFIEAYPHVKLDEMNAVFHIKEFEIKDSTLKMPKNLRFKDTIGKKSYQSGIEFYSPIYVKNFVKARAIEDWSPELVRELNDIKQLMNSLVPTQQAISNTQLMMVNLLKKLAEKESFFDKIKRLFK